MKVSQGSRTVVTERGIFGGGAVWVLAPMAIFILLTFVFRGSDPDVWWHLKAGEYIFSKGIPHTDPFSFTAAGTPWVLHEWLSEVLFYFVVEKLGFFALTLLMGVCGVFVILLLFVAARLAGGDVLTSFAVASLGLSLSSVVVGVRPQIFTILFLSAQYAILLAHDSTISHWRAPKLVWLLPPLMCLWANLHGGYIIGIAVLALWSVQHKFRSSVVVPIVCAVAATLFTPNGFHGWWYPFTYAGSGNASMVFLQEWQSPNFHLSMYLPLLVAVCVICTVGVLGVFPGALGFAYSGGVILFLALALRSARHSPLFGVALVPVLAVAVVTRLPFLSAVMRRYSPPIVGSFLSLAVVVVMLVAPKVAPVAPQLGVLPNQVGVPQKSVEYLRSKAPQPLFNEYAWGGYCIYSLFPEWKVFIDGRADVHGDPAMHRYHNVLSARAGWQEVLQKFDIRYVLVSPAAPLADALARSSEWRKVISSDHETLFEKL